MYKLADAKRKLSKLIRLDLELLSTYESVMDQYQHLGVKFDGAIALKPSNPGFFPESGSVVLMPIGNTMQMSICFRDLVSSVNLRLCGSSPIILTAYDRNGLGVVDTLRSFDTEILASMSDAF